jgi:RNA polymerase sigma-70 factor (ECF subfamily)
MSIPLPAPVPCPATATDGADLMLRVQADDPGAFAELVRRYWAPVFGRFFRQFRDRQEAEDLSQDVFLRLYRSRKRYRPKARFTTLLFHIAQNVARNAVRTRKRKPCVPVGRLGESSSAGRPLAARPEAPSRSLERAELAGVVHAAVARLGGRQRLALELFQFEHRSCGEIAETMDMTPKAARSLLYRARNQLRECLGQYLEM